MPCPGAAHQQGGELARAGRGSLRPEEEIRRSVFCVFRKQVNTPAHPPPRGGFHRPRDQNTTAMLEGPSECLVCYDHGCVLSVSLSLLSPRSDSPSLSLSPLVLWSLDHSPVISHLTLTSMSVARTVRLATGALVRCDRSTRKRGALGDERLCSPLPSHSQSPPASRPPPTVERGWSRLRQRFPEVILPFLALGWGCHVCIARHTCSTCMVKAKLCGAGNVPDEWRADVVGR